MTIDEFVQGLSVATAGEQARWIRGAAGLRLVDSESGEVECPLTFLCRVLTGNVYATGEYQRAADHLNIGFNDAYRIVSVADSLTSEVPELPPFLTHTLAPRLLAATRLAKKPCGG